MNKAVENVKAKHDDYLERLKKDTYEVSYDAYCYAKGLVVQTKDAMLTQSPEKKLESYAKVREVIDDLMTSITLAEEMTKRYKAETTKYLKAKKDKRQKRNNNATAIITDQA